MPPLRSVLFLGLQLQFAWLLLVGGPCFAKVEPSLDAFFMESPAAYGLSPDGSWFAFVVRSGDQSIIYTRSPALNKGYKITGIAGQIDQLVWTADAQFVVHSIQGDRQHLYLTDPQGAISWDFTPPNYKTAVIVPNQPSPARTGKLYFTARQSGLAPEELLALIVPKGGVTKEFETNRLLYNILAVDNWLFRPDGSLIGGIANKGDQRKLYLASGDKTNDQAAWSEIYSGSPDEVPDFAGFACPPGFLIAQGYFGSDFSKLVLFDPSTRQTDKTIIKQGASNIKEIFLSPDLSRLDAYNFYDRVGEAIPLNDDFSRFQRTVNERTQIADAFPLVVTPDYQRALLLQQSDRTAPKYWHVDLKNGKPLLVYDVGELLTHVSTYPMKPLTLKARDGLDLPCFWTEPKTSSSEASLVILVTGGPFVGIHREWSGLIQALASRGATVLTMNYRGARGFGKRFYEAGLGQADAAMINDVADVIEAVNKSGTKWKKKIVVGLSFGGYLTARAVARAPQGIDAIALINPLVDPTEFFRLAARDVGSADFARFEQARWYGSTPLDDIIALYNLPALRTPALVVQSQRDERVPLATARLFIRSLSAYNSQVKLVEIDDLHDIAQPRSWIRVTDELLTLLKGK